MHRPPPPLPSPHRQTLNTPLSVIIFLPFVCISLQHLVPTTDPTSVRSSEARQNVSVGIIRRFDHRYEDLCYQTLGNIPQRQTTSGLGQRSAQLNKGMKKRKMFQMHDWAQQRMKRGEEFVLILDLLFCFACFC